MVRNLNSLIFIYILVVSCTDSSYYNNNPVVGCELPTHLSVDAPSLELDENGYYHMEYLEGYNQTFTTLEASTGVELQKLAWMSSMEVEINGVWTNLVNSYSYTNDDGIGNTVLGVFPSQVGDTIKVWCGYEDDCQIYFLDSLKVIVENIEWKS